MLNNQIVKYEHLGFVSVFLMSFLASEYSNRQSQVNILSRHVMSVTCRTTIEMEYSRYGICSKMHIYTVSKRNSEDCQQQTVCRRQSNKRVIDGPLKSLIFNYFGFLFHTVYALCKSTMPLLFCLEHNIGNEISAQ